MVHSYMVHSLDSHLAPSWRRIGGKETETEESTHPGRSLLLTDGGIGANQLAIRLLLRKEELDHAASLENVRTIRQQPIAIGDAHVGAVRCM